MKTKQVDTPKKGPMLIAQAVPYQEWFAYNDSMITYNLTGPCHDLEHETKRITLAPKAMDRIMHLCSQPKLLVSQAFPLAVYFIANCKHKAECLVSYRQAASDLGVSHGTIKNWSVKLVDLGLISKEPKGTDGIMIRLAPAVLAGDQGGMVAALINALRILRQEARSARSVVDTVTRDVESGLQKVIEALQ